MAANCLGLVSLSAVPANAPQRETKPCSAGQVRLAPSTFDAMPTRHHSCLQAEEQVVLVCLCIFQALLILRKQSSLNSIIACIFSETYE